MIATAVVGRTVSDRRRSVLWYGAGLALMVIWVMAIYPSMAAELEDYLDAMPDAMKSLFGGQEIASLAGFVYAEIFSLMGPIVFLAFAITAGAGSIAGEERDRVLPVVLATGVGRGTLVLSKLVAVLASLAVLAAFTLGSLLAGLAIVGGGMGIGATVAATVQLMALGLLFGTLTLALGAWVGRRAAAAGVAAGAALGFYLLDALAGMVSWLEPARVVSPFHWYAPGNPLVDGLAPGWLALSLAVTGVFAVAAVIGFDRRDVGV